MRQQELAGPRSVLLLLSAVLKLNFSQLLSALSSPHPRFFFFFFLKILPVGNCPETRCSCLAF